MTRHSLAIRYCGGCRASYDQTATVQAILDGLREKGLEIIPEYNAPAPAGLLVCGCMTQCLFRDAVFPSAWRRIGPDGLFDDASLSFAAAVERIYDDLLEAKEY